MKKFGGYSAILLIVCGIIAAVWFMVERNNQLQENQSTFSLAAPTIQNQPITANVPLTQLDATTSAVISAQSYIVYDVTANKVIASKNANLRLMPASTTKIMTAMIALEEYDQAEILTISRAAEAIGHTVDFLPGEQFRVEDMILAMLVNSGNDAAVSLADHHPLGYQTFVNLMNQKAISLGLKNTHFSNVSGVEAGDHYSSAEDLVTISIEAMKNPTFRSMVSTKAATIKTIDGKQKHQLKNLNELLWTTPGVIGIKTGWTEIAGDCLVTYISRNKDIIMVVLDSRDRFADTRTLIEWVFNLDL